MNVPVSAGVPLIVKTPPLKLPETPSGRLPEVIEAPVALPVTLYVTDVIAVFLHAVWLSVPVAEVRVRAPFSQAAHNQEILTWPLNPFPPFLSTLLVVRPPPPPPLNAVASFPFPVSA